MLFTRYLYVCGWLTFNFQPRSIKFELSFLRSVSYLSIYDLKWKASLYCFNVFLFSCLFFSQKRQRFSNHVDSIDVASSQEMCTISHVSNVNNGDICTSNGHDGNSIGTDSLLQNNLECHVPNGDEETVEMDFECQTVDTNGCPPNLKDESISPAREFLQK